MIYFFMCVAVWFISFFVTGYMIARLNNLDNVELPDWLMLLFMFGIPTAVTFLYYQLG